MEKLAEQYQEQGIEFLLAYIIEPHPEEKGYEEVTQPDTYEQRAALARATIEACGIRRKTVIDTMDNDFYLKFGGCPNMVYIIDPAGLIVYHDRWASHPHVGEFLAALKTKS